MDPAQNTKCLKRVIGIIPIKGCIYDYISCPFSVPKRVLKVFK